MVKTYKEDEESDYLVVENPFAMVPPDKRPSDRQSFARLGEWFRVMLGAQYDPVDFVYWTRTRDEVLVKIPKGYDLFKLPVLGQHIWPPTWKKPPSNIYLYNYKVKGNPGHRDGWIEEAPDPLSEGVKLPLPSPYPRPRRPKDHTISQHIRRMGWALPWPQEMLRSPSPEPKVKVKPEVPGGAVPKTEADVKPVIPTVKTESQDQSAKLKSKMDPYEQEEASLWALRSNGPVKLEPGSEAVKGEPSEDYKPSPALLEAYRQWQESAPATNSGSAVSEPSHQNGSTMAPAMKTEPVVKPEPGVPPAQRDQNRPQAVSSSNVSGHPSVKREPNQSQTLYPPSSQAHHTQGTQQPGQRQYPYAVKSEPGQDNISPQGYPYPSKVHAQYPGQARYPYPAVKPEPSDHRLSNGGPQAYYYPRRDPSLNYPGPPGSQGSRSYGAPPVPAQVERTRDPRLANRGGMSRGTKRENDESEYDLSKRQRQ